MDRGGVRAGGRRSPAALPLCGGYRRPLRLSSAVYGACACQRRPASRPAVRSHGAAAGAAPGSALRARRASHAVCPRTARTLHRREDTATSRDASRGARMTTVLGISALYHDSAAALVRDGSIVAAAHEERFTRRKHDPRFPLHAINYCLEEAFIEARELDAVVFYDHPLWTLDRAMKSLLAVAPRGQGQWMQAARSLLGVKLHVGELVRDALKAEVPLMFTEHHASHAASAFYPSPFEDAAILTLDGVGEWATTTIGHGSGDRIEIRHSLDYPHSLGLLYSAITYFCGFKVNSGEYKLMGLAPYGEPVYEDVIRERLIHICEDGSYRLDTGYFGYLDSNEMVNDRFAELFGGPRRPPESRITRR